MKPCHKRVKDSSTSGCGGILLGVDVSLLVDCQEVAGGAFGSGGVFVSAMEKSDGIPKFSHEEAAGWLK